MNDRTETLFFSAAGPIAALTLAVALIPLRGLTPASTFSFGFIALTIAAAEFGGQWAAIATALTSALSLDFFLTRPYMHLSMQEKDDVIAFAGLTFCGLMSAAFAAERGKGAAARRQLELLRSVLGRLEHASPLESRVSAALNEIHSAMPVAALRVRDMHDHVLGRIGKASIAGPSGPRLELAALENQPSLALPLDGAVIPLLVDGQQVGWFDVWGAGTQTGIETRRTLSAIAQALAAALAVLPRPASR